MTVHTCTAKGHEKRGRNALFFVLHFVLHGFSLFRV
nr:MAG TPA: hypothetical protein [Caudoviricetes sp.]